MGDRIIFHIDVNSAYLSWARCVWWVKNPQPAIFKLHFYANTFETDAYKSAGSNNARDKNPMSQRIVNKGRPQYNEYYKCGKTHPFCDRTTY